MLDIFFFFVWVRMGAKILNTSLVTPEKCLSHIIVTSASYDHVKLLRCDNFVAIVYASFISVIIELNFITLIVPQDFSSFKNTLVERKMHCTKVINFVILKRFWENNCPGRIRFFFFFVFSYSQSRKNDLLTLVGYSHTLSTSAYRQRVYE